MNAGEQLIQQGVERGVRSLIEAVLSARGLRLSDVSRARIAACHDVSTLTQWLERAATAPSEAEVFKGGEGGK